MEWTSVHLSLLMLTCFSAVLSVLAEEGYLVAYPLAFRPGVEEKLSVTIFDYNDSVLVEARIKWRNKTLANIGETITGKGSLIMKVPDYVTGKAVLEICGNCQIGSQGFNFKNSSEITVLEKSTSVFIQTDKPIYKPEQTVLINLFTTGPDLRPRNVPMLVYILDPKGSRMIQWKNLKPTCCGIVNASFPLSDQPVLGVWTILVDMEGHMYNKTFTVEKYVLPRFEVVIEPPGFIRDTNKCSRATVHAKYTFGQPVKGKLSINMNLHGLGYFDDYVGRNVYLFMDINGTAMFDICINNLTNSPLKTHFRGTIRIEASVTSNDGNVFTAMDDTCLVHKQLVSIEFAPETKKHFKPGLPYYGRLFVFYPDDTPASNVVIRINVDRNTDIVFREEYEAIDGEVSFEIPSLPDGDGLLWLDALIVAVDGRSVGNSYLSHFLSLGSWYSPSNCHLLMKAQPKLKVGTRASVKIQSTCPCNFSLHYEIMSRGNIVTSGITEVGREKRDVQTLEAADLNSTLSQCETEISFMVTAPMSPTSRLLIYYVRDDEEGVVDTMQIEVEPSFENKVSVTWSRNETTPKSHVNMLISAKPDSCVCLATVDKSVQLLRPGYQITPEKVFAEMAKYDLSEERYEDTFWWRSTFRRKRSPMWNAMRLRDADFAFREAGLRVMTNKVQLRFQDLSALHGDGTGFSQQNTRKRSVPRTDKRRRAYFPETWVFNCFNISSTRRDNYIQLQVPDSITTWQTDVVALSQTHGMGVATTIPLIAFKEFFVEYTLPYSVIRGEQLRVPLTVFNYLDVCVKVRVSMQIQEGIKFLNHGGRGITLDQCLQAKESLTTPIELVFNELGKKRIHAGAEALMTMSCDCSDEGGISDMPPTLLALDKVTNNILVEPEGIPRGYTYSVFFCPNERIHISTPNYDEYQFVHPPEEMDSFSFLCKATSNAKIALSRAQTDFIDYEIILGGLENSQSWISKGRGGERLQMTMTPNIVSWEEFRAFWISWTDGQIQIGYGETKSNASVILTLDDPSAIDMTVQYIGFATGTGSLGEFRIWRRKGNNEIYHEAFTLSLPLNFVPGSERAQATMIADVMGPTLNNLHNLIRLPFGCGEQNMIHFAPNVYIMRYLQRTNQLSSEIKNEATGYLIQGYQRQLTYKRHDGSYSAFGENDSSGSMWLTAFVLKSFAQSRSFIYIDPREMAQSRRWIIAQKGDDGSFPPVGRVLNKDIQGGIQGKVSLTAYVVVALMEAGVDSQEERNSIKEAQKFLEDNMHPAAITDPYTAALVAYALTLRKSDYAPMAERMLSNMAIRKGGQTYWRLNNQPLETLPFFAHMGNIKQTVTSAEVEMTAYALLTYTLLGDIAYSLPIVKWLTQQRNSLGGFSSTQDTCVALQALSEYATLAYVGHVNLNVTLAYTNFITSVEEHFYLNNENSKVLQVMEIPAFTQTLFIGAVGEGCGLMQVDMSYNIPDPTKKEAFRLSVKMSEMPPSSSQRKRRRRSLNGISNEVTADLAHDDDYRVSMEVCSRWLHAGSSNMAVVEVSLLTGFSADIESLERLILDRQNKLKRYEIDGRKVILYFDEMASQCLTCVTFHAWRNFVVGKMQPVPVKVYDYYEPHYEETRFYNVSSASPLARELCEDDHPDCNRVEDQNGPRMDLPTITVTNSDDDLSLDDQSRCGCQRSCQHEPGSVVCGSDGRLYANYCYMEVASCQMEIGIRAMPKYMCPDQDPVGSENTRQERPGGGIQPPLKPAITIPDNNLVETATQSNSAFKPNINTTSITSVSNDTSESFSDYDPEDSSFTVEDGRKVIGSADFLESADFRLDATGEIFKDEELGVGTEPMDELIPEVTKIAPVVIDLKNQKGLSSELDLGTDKDLVEEINLSPHVLSDEGVNYPELPPEPSSSITPKTVPPKESPDLQPSTKSPTTRNSNSPQAGSDPAMPSELVLELPEEDRDSHETMPAMEIAEIPAVIHGVETPGETQLIREPGQAVEESVQPKLVDPISKYTGTDPDQPRAGPVQSNNETQQRENIQDQPMPAEARSDQLQSGPPLYQTGELKSPTEDEEEMMKARHHSHHHRHHIHHVAVPSTTVATGRRRKRDSE
ncbi:C3 and PZP-like alpha-2-macroglobulin domain-containing protein 8 isoform X1 [Lytechinus pictus]|uniref:C3 and PZP-like alpha-2-macroglobulin domain-containing protein 8 isoform X1 n=2 Tax=Lytechinus pictus TaxID=7653 RepID=UPI0030B9D17D